MKKILAIIVLISICSCSSVGNSTTSGSNESVQVKKEKNEKDGSSFETAIIIKASNEMDGVRAEYTKLAKLYPNYKVKSQGQTSKGSKQYDIISIITAEGESKSVYFDITNFFGKF